ncbi:MAG: glutamine-hydrolyzing GMP synthase, partial [Deltaproteobacteria bacterium]|nr:glutamine-hydrolyzing GMP synthase [Deltaproteobacteria bacterium]
MRENVLVLDFGSQYTQLIARRIRESGVFSEIRPFHVSIDEVIEIGPKAMILSGGPASVWDDFSPSLAHKILELGIPILGICYGMQLIVHLLGGKVERSQRREFGPSEMEITDNADIFSGIPQKTSVWMSHSDRVLELPAGFSSIASSVNSPIAAMKSDSAKIFGIQFHAEVVHTLYGKEILSNFLFRIAGCSGDWTPRSFAENTIKEIREKVGKSHVICALSGGVDSSVTALILQRAIWERLYCIFVDTGLLRLDEGSEVLGAYRRMGFNVIHVDAKDRFLKKLRGVTDPEKKRKIIG